MFYKRELTQVQPSLNAAGPDVGPGKGPEQGYLGLREHQVPGKGTDPVLCSVCGEVNKHRANRKLLLSYSVTVLWLRSFQGTLLVYFLKI